MKTRVRKHVSRRRRSAPRWFNQYSIEAVMNTGLDQIRNLGDLRARSKRIAQDSGLWDRVERYLAAAKQEAAELQALREYMEDNYGKRRKGRAA